MAFSLRPRSCYNHRLKGQQHTPACKRIYADQKLQPIQSLPQDFSVLLTLNGHSYLLLIKPQFY